MELSAILEAILFILPDPVALSRLAELAGASEQDVAVGLSRLAEARQGPDSGLRLVEVAGGWQLRTASAASEEVTRAVQGRPAALTPPVLETLAVIAYRQPVTRADIESIRGVRADHSLAVLLARGLVRVVGRQSAPGRPILYGTTPEFLEWCGLRSVDELPPLLDEQTGELDPS